MSIDRQYLHQLLDQVPESELRRIRLALCPIDDEPVTEADAEAMAAGLEDLRQGRVVSHEEILKEFGLA
jgi:predicted transcriptional regulator